MRTTLTIDEKTDLQLRRIAKEQNISYKDVINRALREGLKGLEAREAPSSFQIRSRTYGFRPGVDQQKLNQLVDEMELEG